MSVTAQTPAAVAATARKSERGGARFTRRHGWTVAIYLLTVALALYWITLQANFGGFAMESLVIAALPLAFAAMAQSVVIISGGIDLSVGAMMSLINVVSAKYMMNHGMGTAIALSLGLIVAGCLAGALTGAMITFFRIPDIIVTLGMLFFWGGLALQIMPQPGGGAPFQYANLASGGQFGGWLPNGLIVLVAVVLILWVPIRWRRPGLALYAVGSNRNSTFLSGIGVTRTRIAAYALGGAFAAIAGLMLTATASSGNATGGDYYTLESVGAAVLGGVALTGGRGGMIGPIAAAFLLALVDAVIVLLGINGNYGQIIEGTLIVVVVMLASVLTRRRRD
jgi:ribose transport system permease protein